jgi:hypothetical protein
LIELPEHDGTQRDPRDVFFGFSGDAVGELTSASTSVSPKARQRTDWSIQIIGPLMMGLGATTFFQRLEPEGSALTPAIVLGVLVAGVVFALLRPDQTATYVGRAGIASARRWHGLVPARTRVLRFADATELRKRFTRVHPRGYYQGTSFVYEWVDRDGRRLFAISGVFPERDHTLDEVVVPRGLRRDHPIYFARAAAAAWDQKDSKNDMTVDASEGHGA